jgi:hypothetical protein
MVVCDKLGPVFGDVGGLNDGCIALNRCHSHDGIVLHEFISGAYTKAGALVITEDTRFNTNLY